MDFYIYRADMPEMELLAKQFAYSALSHRNENVLWRIADYGALLKQNLTPDKIQSAAFCAALDEVMRYNALYQALSDDLEQQDAVLLENMIAVEIATAFEGKRK